MRHFFLIKLQQFDPAIQFVKLTILGINEISFSENIFLKVIFIYSRAISLQDIFDKS